MSYYVLTGSQSSRSPFLGRFGEYRSPDAYDNDIAAQSSGVNVFRSKMFVWVIAAYACGVVGAVVALNLLRIQPAAAFSINWTAYALFIVVIGGFGTIEGPIIGAVIYFALLQSLSQYGTLYMLLLGIVAVIMATVPEPCAKRSSAPINQTKMMTGICADASTLLSTSPTPEAVRTLPKPPPAPVISRTVPADATETVMLFST